MASPLSTTKGTWILRSPFGTKGYFVISYPGRVAIAQFIAQRNGEEEIVNETVLTFSKVDLKKLLRTFDKVLNHFCEEEVTNALNISIKITSGLVILQSSAESLEDRKIIVAMDGKEDQYFTMESKSEMSAFYKALYYNALMTLGVSNGIFQNINSFFRELFKSENSECILASWNCTIDLPYKKKMYLAACGPEEKRQDLLDFFISFHFDFFVNR